MNALNGLSGKLSIMRILVSTVVISVLATWMTANIICWVHGCQMVGIGTQEVSLILGALAAKSSQRLFEAKTVIPTDKTQ